MSEEVDVLIEQLHDLHKQATEERSHYYVGRRTKLAAGMLLIQSAEIRTLRARLSRLSALLDEAEGALGPIKRAVEFEGVEALSGNRGVVLRDHSAGHIADWVCGGVTLEVLRRLADLHTKIAKEKSE